MKVKRTLLYLIGLPNLAVGLLWGMNISLMPQLVNSLENVDNSKVGLLISMGAFNGIFVQYLAGLLSDRSNFKMGKRKPFMIIGILVTTVSICIMPFVPSYFLLFIVAFIFYFSLNFFQGPYYSLIPEIAGEENLGLANGFARVVSVLGSALIFTTGPILWDLDSSININHCLPFFVAALLGLSTVIITAVFIKENPEKVTQRPKKLSFDFIKFPSAIKLFLTVFFVYLGYGCLTPFFVRYCEEYLQFTNQDANNALLLLTVVGALFAYPLGIIADKISRKKVMVAGILIFGIPLALGSFITEVYELHILMSIMGIGFVAIQITSYTILAEIVPGSRIGEFMGIFNFFVSISQFLANNIMGNLLDRFGYEVYFPAALSFIIIAALILGFSKIEKYKEDCEE